MKDKEKKGRAKSIEFEEALLRLEELLKELDGGEIPLSKLVEKYKEGTEYLNICKERLSKAELAIESLNDEKTSSQTFSIDNSKPAH